MEGEARQATVHGLTKSQTWRSDFTAEEPGVLQLVRLQRDWSYLVIERQLATTLYQVLG